VSYYDVRTVQDAIEQEYRVKVSIALTLVKPTSGPWAHYVSVTAHSYPKADYKKFEGVTAGYFPSNEWATMAGCMFRLLHELDALLDKEQRVKAQGEHLF
jgi:hypothetical protein